MACLPRIARRAPADAPGISFSPAIIRELFPFHVAFDRDLRVTQLGRVMERLCGPAAIGARFAEHFRILTPAVPAEFSAIREQSFTVFFVEFAARGLTLKGQMLASEADFPGRIVFLCSPVLREMAALRALGLTLKDFAIHDAAVDFLILLQTKTNTISDVRKMAERLKQEVAVRREAEAQLMRSNDALEARVRARTADLERMNGELGREIDERRRIAGELQRANVALQVWVARLEQRNREMALLNKMGDMLQACRSQQETASVVADSLQRLFPGCGGLLALSGGPGEGCTILESWGRLRDRADPDGDECCEVLMRRLDAAATVADAAGAAAAAEDATDHACLALRAQGETLGVLYLEGLAAPAAPAGPARDDSRSQLVHAAAEHIALAMANIRLQDDLRQQTMRDPLTGLANRRALEEALEREAARARRNAGSLGIVLFDIDHFKRVNDTRGHAAGDAVLRKLGRMLRARVRGEDLACRYGGEEFMLLLPGASLAHAAERAEQIRAEVARDLRVSFERRSVGPVTVSVGVGAYPMGLDGPVGEAVLAVDDALYRAKQRGRNRVEVATGVAPPAPAVEDQR